MPKKKIHSSTVTWTLSFHSSSFSTLYPSIALRSIFLGDFSKSVHGNKWIICTDHLTRYAETKSLPATEAEVATFQLEKIFLRHRFSTYASERYTRVKVTGKKSKSIVN
ncbi:hypothetical protein AVEN_18791-1 [Araneus ventricosus]|uniref:Uncharacterized protein n=1 Tax=Araneus ventricosus TaxID=182803 RepID=A0A4Y2VHQ1_ARAVE|nr:hypothetical protein AVEN_18791-1 [Araneus ventricosus]